ncbi:thiol-disulfide oxidoreductase DCC family protein [Rhodospirillum centenum]|uniref:DUF393 domain-containing protein n=1 Tax=Rhodospirillum centenum (strain ATCC 51521 / SW) TaxID=414684 RepID=B6IU01_RHOCS|nr:DUF393 domain-containing protein [Rhodospirillum centenum]ACI99537.1 conserved hypothetical protein [Rhodospirillum centenum SW]
MSGATGTGTLEREVLEAGTCGLTTLYNGRCPVCRPEVEHYARLDARAGGGNAWIDLYRAPDLLARHGLDAETVKRRLHVIGPYGRVATGVDAFLLIWGSLPRYRWLAALVGSRPVRPVAGLVYDRVLAPLLYAHTRRREARERGAP